MCHAFTCTDNTDCIILSCGLGSDRAVADALVFLMTGGDSFLGVSVNDGSGVGGGDLVSR